MNFDPRLEDIAGAVRVEEDIQALAEELPNVARDSLGHVNVFMGVYTDGRGDPFWAELGGSPELQARGSTRTQAHTNLLARLLDYLDQEVPA